MGGRVEGLVSEELDVDEEPEVEMFDPLCYDFTFSFLVLDDTLRSYVLPYLHW